ncbi:MAG: Rrf2 family transcriptional regulator [Chloroflexi bacterium]|nr:Rrf2 family transcriptional regulator [Chloroflexota bacterium]
MKVDYGVRALIDLAQHGDEGPVRTSDIAGRENIPEPYLDHLLTILSKSGFIQSKRGPQGGHVLSKSPQEISLGVIMSTLDVSSSLLDCFDEPSTCTLYSTCAQREVWRSMGETAQNLLSSITIGDLAQRQKRLSSKGIYQI